MKSKTNTPRGIRNNNPLNLRVGNHWQGEVAAPTDRAFEQFTDMKWGVRAAFIVLRNYIRRHKCNTVRNIITRWAPSCENDTDRYIATVCRRAHLEPDQVIDFDQPDVMTALLLAMCFVENGCEISLDEAMEGYRLARMNKRIV